ncbi:MAG TPA: glycosyltransferase [Symbiobacteriaceae bacterium]|jgi:glycosyltransferase involved in cell wall biosynthesis
MMIYALLVLIAGLALLLELWAHRQDLPRLTRLPVAPPDALPRLTVVMPACNEVDTIRAAARSVLAQEYPGLELLLVNDRSADGTAEAMAEVARAYPDQVRVVQIDRLPPRWLGKNHALWKASRLAKGEWLLFTDADVIMAPDCLRKAVSYALAHKLDHLALFPEVTAPSYLTGAFVSHFIWSFYVFMKPYRANDPWRNEGIGVGAFNLVRQEAYAEAGGHAAISLRPDEDVRLGQRLKSLGCRQGALSGFGLVRVEWYPSVAAMIHGLEKNTYAGMDYNPVMALVAICLIAALEILPYVAVFFASGWSRALLLGSMATHLVMFLLANRDSSRPAWQYVLLLPALAILFSYTLARAVVLTLLRGGINWRGTFYPLRALRRQTGLEGVPPERLPNRFHL